MISLNPYSFKFRTLIILALSVFVIYCPKLALANVEAEEASKELGRMLQQSQTYSDSQILNKASEIMEKFPESDQAEFAKHIYEVISSKVTPTIPKEPTAEELEDRARANLILFYEDPISLSKVFAHSSHQGRSDSIHLRMTESSNGKKLFTVTFKSITNSWIFFHSVDVRCGEKVFTFNFKGSEIYRTVIDSRNVLETASLPAKGKALAMLDCLKANPKQKIIRFSGKELATENISGTEIESIQDMLLIKRLVETRKF